MVIKRIFAKFNGNPKTVKTHEELVTEYSTYKNLTSLSLTIETDEGYFDLSLLSACNFIVSGNLQENIKKRKGR